MFASRSVLRFQTALSESGADPTSVLGVGFDATCSLVVLDTDLRPLTVSPDGELIIDGNSVAFSHILLYDRLVGMDWEFRMPAR